MALRRTDRRYYTLAYTGKDRIFAGTADELTDVGTHSHTGLGDKLDAVLGDSSDGRSVDDLGIYAHLDSLEHIAAGKVDGGGHLKAEIDVGLRCRHEGVHHALHITAGKVVSLEIVARNIMEPGLVSLDKSSYDHACRHLAYSHKHKLQQRDLHTAYPGRNPQEERTIIEEDYQRHDGEHDNQYNSQFHFMIY